MPDPVSPRSSTPQTIELEPVVITASPSRPAPADEIDIGATALACIDKVGEAAVALLMASRVNPYAGAVGAFSAGFDLGRCVAQSVNRSHDEASIHEAVTRCTEEGGTPLGVIEHQLACAVEEP